MLHLYELLTDTRRMAPSCFGLFQKSVHYQWLHAIDMEAQQVPYLFATLLPMNVCLAVIGLSL